jgi:hypothetical protein
VSKRGEKVSGNGKTIIISFVVLTVYLKFARKCAQKRRFLMSCLICSVFPSPPHVSPAFKYAIRKKTAKPSLLVSHHERAFRGKRSCTSLALSMPVLFSR